MTMRHHGEEMGDEFRKAFGNPASARQRLQEQIDGTAKRAWSEGRIGPDDDGDLAFAVGTHPDKELVVVDFGKQVTFIAMSPQQAITIAQALIKKARAISTKPLSIVLH